MLLAAFAETEVRLVHLALEQLYRTRLVAMELAARLDSFSGKPRACAYSRRRDVRFWWLADIQIIADKAKDRHAKESKDNGKK